jgi:uncharacterized protein YbaP (TraB family)
MRRIAALFFTAVFCLHAAFVHADTAVKPAAGKSATAKKSAASIPLRGTLYRIDYRGHTCYLFGTVHVGQAAFYPLEPQVTRALHQADQLVIEVDIRNVDAFKQAIARQGLYPNGETIGQHLSVDGLTQLKDVLQRNGIAYDNVARMKPWMLANLLIVQEMARSGFPTEQGIETYFLSVADKEKKKIGELETADYQLSLFNTLSDTQQQDYLRETLEDLNDGTGIQKSIALIDAWQRADSAKMEALKQEMLTDDSASSRFIEDILLNQRNPGMADKIETLFKTEKATFVAIGALHLIGDKSVPALLKQRGYQVTKLY